MDGSRRRLKAFFACSLGGVVFFFMVYIYFDEKPRPLAPTARGEEQWDPRYYVPYRRNYKFTMDDTPTCKSSTPFLILMIPVAPCDRRSRDTIRKTWGSEKLVLDQRVETVFMLGLPGGADAEQQQAKLQEENLEHHDLIQSDFLDSYHNLTIKTMMMLEWLERHCKEAKYAMKIDSDMLLHAENLVRLLLDPGTARENYMTGLVWWHSPVLRNPLNKFYMPTHVFGGSEYPPYPLGMAYVMSTDLPSKILKVSPQIKPLCIEDVYLGMCLKLLGISPTAAPEETMFIVDPTHPLSDCGLSKVVAVTTTSGEQMTAYWQRSKQPTAKC